MALTLRGTPTQLIQSTAAATSVINVPAGVVAGDLMLIFIAARTVTTQIDPLAGWTKLCQSPIQVSGSATAIYWRISPGGEPASYTLTVDTTASVRSSVTMIAYQGGTGDWDTTTPIGPFSNTAYNIADANIQAASITTANANANIFTFAYEYLSAAIITFTPPTALGGFTAVSTISDNLVRVQHQVSKAVWTGSGATGVVNTTSDQAAITDKHAILFALNPLANMPLMTTEAVTSITVVGGTGNGTVTSENGSAVTDRGICWSTTPNPTKANSWASAGSGGLGAFTAAISGLLSNTLYYVRAYGTSANGTGYSTTDVTFTTSASVTTQAVSSIGNTTATGNATSQADGGVTITDRGVCWSISANPTKANSWVSAGSGGVGAYTSSMTGLTPGQFYYVCGYTTNANGTSYGASDVTFTTTTPPSSLTNCKIDVSKLTAGNYWCSVNSPSIFQNCTFTGGGGHAIRIIVPGTYSFVGNIFNSFGAIGSTGAAIINDSGGVVTLNISGGGNIPTYKNGTGTSTVINNIVNLTIKCIDENNNNLQNIVVYVENASTKAQILSDLTNTSGIVTTIFNYPGSDVDINIRIRKASAGTNKYIPIKTSGTITTNGFNLTTTLYIDTVVAP